MDMYDLFLDSYTHKIVSHDIQNNMVNHSYMIVTQDSILASHYAKYVASAFLCEGENKPCGKCNVCKRIEHGNYSDVIVYPKGDKDIVTEDINEIVLDECVLPFEGDKKVYILYNFDKATVQAQNKLLKTLEEPNPSTIFVLTASNIEGVLPTIRSRSKKIVEGMLDEATIADYLESTGVDKQTAMLVAGHSFGNITYATSHTNSAGKEIIELARDIFNNMLSSAMVLKYANKVMKYKANLDDLVSQMMVCVSIMARAIATGQKSAEYNLNKYNLNSLSHIAYLCEETLKKYNANCNVSAVIDSLLFGILEVKYKYA